MDEVRLQKFLASCGIASRRKCEELILAGKVEVNGKVVNELGTKVNIQKDEVKYNGKIIKPEEEKIYILLNKPIGYVTTVKEQFGRDKVTDLVKQNKRIVPVGRLDMYTSGALILTNDGELVNKLTHPKNKINKTYNVTVAGIVTEQDIENLKSGVEIDNSYITKPAKVKILKIDNEKNISRVQITIHEGKNRQIRKMCQAINKRVLALHRSKIGNIEVRDLKLGTWRYLTKKEVNELKHSWERKVSVMKKIKYIIIFLIIILISAGAIYFFKYYKKEEVTNKNENVAKITNTTEENNTMIVGIDPKKKNETPKQNTVTVDETKDPATLTQEIYNLHRVIGTLVIPKTKLNIEVYSDSSADKMEKMPGFLYTTGGLNKKGITLIVGHNRMNRKNLFK